jgi:hypothetical protein
VSVEFWPPVAQNWQRPIVLFPKPQLSGSFVMPSMQPPVVPLNELAGNAQLVKSALIWAGALLLGFEQRALSATMLASLSACKTYFTLM